MAKRNPADVAVFLIGGREIVGDLRSFDDSREALIEPSETLGDTWGENSFVGVRTAKLSIEGFYDDRQGGIHDALSASADLTPVLVYGLAGSTYGAEFVGWAGAKRKTYERQLSIGALTKVAAEFETNGPVDFGKQLWYYHIASATGNTTGAPVDNGVSTTGLAGYLQYGATAGEANISIIHSSDGVTWGTLINFTQTVKGVATGSYAAERVVTTAVAERYLAMNITTATATGAGTTAGLAFFVGAARNLTTG